MSERTESRPWAFAILLIVTGVVGWLSSFELTVSKIRLLEDPGAALSCDFSILVQCGTNLSSWQGSLFGFANSIIGLGAFAVPIVIGMALLAGARFADWFWWGFLAGVTAGFAWVVWFIAQSLWEIGKLCPWCMTMWAAMIPLFWATLWRVLRDHVPLPARARAVVTELSGWTWVFTILSYAIIALLAQLQLDWISYL